MSRTWFNATLAAVTAGALLHGGLSAAAQSATTFQPDPSTEQVAPYLAPQTLAHIGGGRTINLVCLGHGSPTAILSPPAEGWSEAWWKVQRPLAHRTRICAWDPAGYGFSSPSPQPQDVVHTTEDLWRALKRGGIEGPYVMVAISLGAYDALRFTDLHRRSVVGMVLVDPSIPDQEAIQERVEPKLAAAASVAGRMIARQLRKCAAELKDGTLKRGMPQFERCTAERNFPPAFSRLKARLAQLNADPARLLTQASAWESLTEDSSEVVNVRRRYGNMPLIVLTAARDASIALPPGTPGASTPAEVAELRQENARFFRDSWGPAHDAYAALSTRGRHQLVPDSGHDIPIEKPAAVILAVNAVLDEISSR